MNDYIQNHLKRLNDLSEGTSIEIIDLYRTYADKIFDYVSRDMHLGKKIDSLMSPKEQSERALHVMEEYATRKLNYHAKDI